MILDVLGRLVGIVVMDRPVIFMVVLDLLVVLQIVRHARIAVEQQRSALQSKALQGQAHQEEDTDESSHKESLKGDWIIAVEKRGQRKSCSAANVRNRTNRAPLA